MSNNKEKLAVIINPNAGFGKGPDLVQTIKNELINTFKLDFEITEKPGQSASLVQKAIKEGASGVVAVGGDGTIYETINGINDSNVFLGIIPAGSANVFSIQMKIPLSTIDACRIIAKKNFKKIDMGQAGEKKFVLMAGVGFDAQVVEEIHPEVKKMLKDLAYKLIGIKTLLTYKPAYLEIEIDQKVKTGGYFVVIGNAKYYAGHYAITRKAKIDDGLLDVCLFTRGKIKDFIKYISGVMTDTHLFFEDVYYYQAKEVIIHSESRVPVQVDGESIGELPMNFKVLPASLKIAVP